MLAGPTTDQSSASTEFGVHADATVRAELNGASRGPGLHRQDRRKFRMTSRTTDKCQANHSTNREQAASAEDQHQPERTQHGRHAQEEEKQRKSDELGPDVRPSPANDPPSNRFVIRKPGLWSAIGTVHRELPIGVAGSCHFRPPSTSRQTRAADGRAVRNENGERAW